MRAVIRAAVELAFQGLRMVLKRPVPGVVAVAVDGDGRYLLVRRSDTGTWGLPGGWIDYGERIAEALTRELREETGYRVVELGRVVGIYSARDRDPRLHSVCVAVEARVELGPAELNPLEITEVRAFAFEEIPAELAFDTRRILDDHRASLATVLA
jgi:8-oxo-dGTP diphosphatase